ncbi:Uncharacterised protein [Actinomyces bovis]|uniref:Uncharacterized protein n=1 Tax=Actinomyces bovis TaxID=1658 RepID=A0ABY1VNP6_9ACTO|nr:hypothetical protein [Actinomyces bovis]SPT53733.1 Uncharacterised protein [Actinomyces bovis]VEG55905.1 Uncharacterised protein [Actinomyces israelii]
MPSQKHSKQSRRFATWTVDARRGATGWFSSPQTPEETLEEATRRLTVPTAMTEGVRFAMGLWALPEGAFFPDDVGKHDPARNTYMQFIGTHEAMVIEARIEHPDGTFEHYTIAREPIQDPQKWTTITYVDNAPPRVPTTTTAQLKVHPEEIFTGQQALEIASQYILEGTLPPNNRLRPINPHRPLNQGYIPEDVPSKGLVANRRPFQPNPPVTWSPTPALSRTELRTTPGPRFMIWAVDAEHGHHNVLPAAMPATQTAQCLEQILTDPKAMTGQQCFSMGVWTLPEGQTAVSKVRKSDPARSNYMQCAGSWQAMTLELRIQQADDTFEHYTIAREPIQDPQKWTTITYAYDILFDGSTQTHDIRLHPEEVFTGQQATTIFTNYVLHATLPPKHLLRKLDL